MKFYKKYPVTALSPFVRYYWYFEIDEDKLPCSQLSFPYGAFELICYLENPNTMQWVGEADEFFEPSIFYAGQLTKPFIMSFNKKCKCVGASLYPWAGNHLYNIPAGEFTNQLAPLDNLESDNGIYDQLKLCTDKNTLFDCLEAYLFKRLFKKQNDPLVYNIARQIINTPTREALNLNISAPGLSRRRIEQRFINSTGLSMGAFTRKARFQKSVHLLKEKHPDINLTAVGLQAGYDDQAHFISDFKSFSGLSPKSFRGQTTELKDFLRGLVMAG
jgi:AraC-like DNA-binding protein